MPCNTIQTAEVEVGKMNADILMSGLQSAGFTARRSGSLISLERDGQSAMYDASTGTLSLRGNSAIRDADALKAEVKRAYSRGVVESQAKKFGWQMKEVAPNKWEVLRR